eukprot:TRINITY_DN7687_c0_g1_i1.p1 TRINITY_DN7687_c0_g1~~TRINITY_DN7687_c0_g1_i1.p1  ORF type:complete len:177 (-),score=26.81 TRINITY_DN7687_c0_g1_i1:99-629(-)
MTTENLSNCKMAILGDSNVGKTSIAIRFVKNEYYPSLDGTIGASFLTKSVTIGEETAKLQIWDTAGQERYRSLTPMYYRGALAALVVFDVSNLDSFKRCKEWINELKEDPSCKDILIVLVGNKCDIEKRVISKEQAEVFANEENIAYFDTSAKDNINIDLAFNHIAEKLINQKKTC